MSEEKITLAIFDFDGTLTEGHLWLGIARHHQEKRVKRRNLLLYMALHLPYWLASKVKLYSNEKNKAKWGEDLSSLFKGFTVNEAQKAFEWVTENYFMPKMRPDVLQELKQHQSQQHKVMLLSGMFTEFLDVIGRRLGVDYVVGTQLEKNNDIFSGRIIPPLCFGENKARLLMEFIQQQRLNVDLGGSSAYADSITDTYIFNLVGHPIAVYPEKDLYRLALDRKWQILDGHNIGGANKLKTGGIDK